jgi:uncharacterized membrane protein
MRLQVSFCNYMPHDVRVAVGYDRTGDNETRSEGWFTFQPCECANVFDEDVKTLDWWVYVKKKGGGELTNGSGAICVRDKKFTLRRANTSEGDCKAMSGNWVNFQRVVPKASPFKLTFGSGAKCL